MQKKHNWESSEYSVKESEKEKNYQNSADFVVKYEIKLNLKEYCRFERVNYKQISEFQVIFLNNIPRRLTHTPRERRREKKQQHSILPNQESCGYKKVWTSKICAYLEWNWWDFVGNWSNLIENDTNW